MAKPNFSTVFGFEGKLATIETMNVRKQGKAEGKEAALDLKICVEGLPAFCLAALIGAPLDEVEKAFWRIEDLERLDVSRGDLVDRRFLGIAGFKSSAGYKKKHAIKIRGLAKVRCDAVDKFEVEPVAGQLVNVTFRAVISDLPEGWVDGAMHRFLEPCVVTLEQDNELPLGDTSSATEKARKAAIDKAATKGAPEKKAATPKATAKPPADPPTAIADAMEKAKSKPKPEPAKETKEAAPKKARASRAKKKPPTGPAPMLALEHDTSRDLPAPTVVEQSDNVTPILRRRLGIGGRGGEVRDTLEQQDAEKIVDGEFTELKPDAGDPLAALVAEINGSDGPEGNGAPAG
jgi:hypothetical protein